MIVEVVPEIGGAPLRLKANQVVIRNDEGTHLVVAATYGLDGTIAVGSVYHDEAEFNRMLSNLGIRATTVVAGVIRGPQPPGGAQLLVGPTG